MAIPAVPPQHVGWEEVEIPGKGTRRVLHGSCRRRVCHRQVLGRARGLMGAEETQRGGRAPWRGSRGGRGDLWMGTHHGVQLEGAARYLASDSLGEKVMEVTYKANIQPFLPASH